MQNSNQSIPKEINPKPTRTFVLDIGRKCNLACVFCYHHHLGDLSNQGWKDINTIYAEIDEGIKRGNNRVEFTGGEPTMYPQIIELIKYLKNRNIKTCIITNGIVGSKILSLLIDAGADEFLISVHGMEKTHNLLTQCNKARQCQNETLNILSSANLKSGFRFNYVINSFNQEEIYDTSIYMSEWKPTMVNFINMNPHHGWQNDKEVKNVIADLSIVEPYLNTAIYFLESKKIGVNVRYYPMCRITEQYRRCVCNDLHVMFDPKEWDYGVYPKTYEKYKEWGINCSNNVEEKGEPCCHCDLKNVCGGANKYWHKASKEVYDRQLTAQVIHSENFDHSDFYYYRKYNYLTLKINE